MMKVGFIMKEYFKEKVGNMRDLGGYGAQGKKVIFDKIIRSNVPTNLDDNDLLFLKNMEIKNIIDLRTRKEQETKISCFEKRTDFNVHHISIPGGDKIPDSIEDVPVSYLRMLDAKNNIATIFDLLVKGERILYFCNAGKDRTGTISMLILMALGVDEETICKDYLKTKDYLDVIIKANSFPENIINIIMPKEEYVKKFLKLFKERYNSIENYLKLIGIDKKSLDKIRQNYLK